LAFGAAFAGFPLATWVRASGAFEPAYEPCTFGGPRDADAAAAGLPPPALAPA
jgi:hypothetical protein